MLHATSVLDGAARAAVDEGEVRPGARWEGALADDCVGVGGHARDRAQEVLGEIDGVRPEVAENSEPCLVPEKPPGKNAPWVGGVCGDPLRAEVAHVADRAGVDELAGMSHGWRMSVVEADDRPHPGACDGLRDRSGPGGKRPTGFSTQTCLPARAAATATSRCSRLGVAMLTASTSGSSTTSRQLSVERSYPSRSTAACALGVFVGCDDEAGDTWAVREVVAASAVRDAVHPTHPADTDQADPDRAPRGHTRASPRPIRHE
jgi:hypothetical protein